MDGKEPIDRAIRKEVACAKKLDLIKVHFDFQLSKTSLSNK